jgi:hypothetical protein
MTHDAEHPVTAHVRVAVRDEEQQRAVEALAAETVRWNRESESGPIVSLDVLVTADQLAALKTAGFALEPVAPVWTAEQLKQLVSQGDRYAERLEMLKRRGGKP